MTTASRLSKLQGFLGQDPNNARLLADTAEAAFDAGEAEEAGALLERYAAIVPLTPALVNLRGLAHLRAHEIDKAAAIFEGLLVENLDTSVLRFNLAWCRSLLGDHAGARDLLDLETVTASPQAAALRIQALHHLGLLEEALAEGEALSGRHPGDTALASALAVVALDHENIDLASHYARAAGGSHEGLSTLGMLVLNEDRLDEAGTYFDRAIAANPKSARGLLGKGLTLMGSGQAGAATVYIDAAAEEFGDHVGSWVAAGWSCYVTGDRTGAKIRWERALALDDTFGETHGALAVLDIDEGRLDAARRRTEVALRLDRACFAGALAQSLLAAADGDAGKSERIRNLALNTRIGVQGRTIAQSMTRLGAKK